jgi:RNA polymerase sigma factor (sigma-70 family)
MVGFMRHSTEPGLAKSHPSRVAENRYFVTTHWTVVLTAGRTDSTRAQDALGKLCRTYWYPLYAYIRQRGHSPHDAQDLVQEFFARLLQRQSLAHLSRDKGKFRSFLLTALRHFLVDEWKKARRSKRGGGQVISLDAQAAEARYALEPADPADVEEELRALFRALAS